MSLEKVYFEFSKGYNDNYYVELAQTEVLVVPIIIDSICDNLSNCRRSERVLEKISKNNPRIVYPYYEYILRLFDSKDRFISWNTWKIITNILSCDTENIWNNLRQKFFEALSSNLIAEFSIACDCVENILKYKPEDKNKIFEILENVSTRDFMFENDPSPTCSAVAEEKVKILFENIEK